MLFPDFSRKLANNVYNYTATEDGYLVINYLSAYGGSVSVDDVIVTKSLYYEPYYWCILYMYVPKGSVIKGTGDMRFMVYGLKKGRD